MKNRVDTNIVFGAGFSLSMLGTISIVEVDVYVFCLLIIGLMVLVFIETEGYPKPKPGGIYACSWAFQKGFFLGIPLLLWWHIKLCVKFFRGLDA